MADTTASARYMTIEQVAEELQVHPRTVYRIVAASQLPTTKVGGSTRIARTALARYLRRQADPAKLSLTGVQAGQAMVTIIAVLTHTISPCRLSSMNGGTVASYTFKVSYRNH